MNQNLPVFSELLFINPPHELLRLSVIVPAKNEAGFIFKTLDALRNQVDNIGKSISKYLYEVLVLANNCSDDTYLICSEYRQNYPDFNLHVESIELQAPNAHIGTARRLLMDAAHRRLINVAGAKGIIVSTDADSEVASDWIYHTIQEIDRGADVIGGRILPRNTPASSRRQHLRDVTYRLLKTRLESVIDPSEFNPWPRHFQCYGPSFAVTCEIYDKAGRLPVIPFLEDEEFRKALCRIDAKIRHSPDVLIYTSGRLDGRVAFGFSVQLQQWADMSINSEQQEVESLSTLIFKFEFKSRLRTIWNQGSGYFNSNLSHLANWANVDYAELMKSLNESIYFESFWEQIDKLLSLPGHPEIGYVPIDSAIAALRRYFNQKSIFKVRIPENILLQGKGAMVG